MASTSVYLLAAVCCLVASQVRSIVDFEYHNYVQLTLKLQDFAKTFPNQTHLYSIGQTVQGFAFNIVFFPTWTCI